LNLENKFKKTKRELFNKEYFTNRDISYYNEEGLTLDNYRKSYSCLISVMKEIEKLYSRVGLFKGGIKALDLGCGFGYLVKMLNDSGVNTKGVDISDYAIENVCAPDIKSKVVCGDILNLPEYFEEDEFNVVFASAILEYYSEEEIYRIMEGLSRVTMDASRLVVLSFTNGGGLSVNDEAYNDKYRMTKISPVEWCKILTYADEVSLEKINMLSSLGEITVFQCSIHGLIENNENNNIKAIGV